MTRNIKDIVNSIVYSFKDNPIPFIIILLGASLQAFRTYHLAYSISDLDNEILMQLDAILAALFFTSGLVYYTIKAGLAEPHDLDSKEIRTRKLELVYKYNTAANYFQSFDTFINLFYSTNKLIIQSLTLNKVVSIYNVPTLNWLLLILAIPIAIGMPVFIRMFAGEIRDKVSYKLQEEIMERIKKLEGIKEVKLTLKTEKKESTYNAVIEPK